MPSLAAPVDGRRAATDDGRGTRSRRPSRARATPGPRRSRCIAGRGSGSAGRRSWRRRSRLGSCWLVRTGSRRCRRSTPARIADGPEVANPAISLNKIPTLVGLASRHWRRCARLTYIGVRNLLKRAAMGDNFFESPAQAKRAMKENLFTEVYLSTAVTTPIQTQGMGEPGEPVRAPRPALAPLPLARRDPATAGGPQPEERRLEARRLIAAPSPACGRGPG